MPVWMTPQAADRLRNELAELIEFTELTGLADVSDVSDEHDPGSFQRRQARIQQIQDLLDDALIGEDPPDDGVAEPGMVLTVRYDDTENSEDSGDTETFLLGVRTAEVGDIDVYSPDSPLGKALVGARQGEQRTYRLPNGAALTVTLLEAVPYQRHLSGDRPDERPVSEAFR
jgi:transcription elongation factor GreA